MEYTTEIINISKIKEGFFIGDRVAGTNFEVIIQFKITHIINAAGTQITNQFENLGIQYLTLNWNENPKQNLFDAQDKIADTIVSFIDNSFKRGEGLLAHSVRGQNRVCIAVVIYLMKKYNWSLKKCIEFLQSKKQDVDISSYFIEQLNSFENRLYNKDKKKRSNTWNDNGTNDPEEEVMRNTYVNGLNVKLIKQNYSLNNDFGTIKIKNSKKGRVGWADSNPYNKNGYLISVNTTKDLMFQKEIKQVTNHLRMRPSRSCMKYRSASAGQIYQSNSNVNTRGFVSNSVNIGNKQDDFKFTFGKENNFISGINIKENNSVNIPLGQHFTNNNMMKTFSPGSVSISSTVNSAPQNTQKLKGANPKPQQRINNFIKENKSQAATTPTTSTSSTTNPNLQYRASSYDKQNFNKYFTMNYENFINDGNENLGTAQVQSNNQNINKNYAFLKNNSNSNATPLESNKNYIFANNYEQIINTNINNIYIQNDPNKGYLKNNNAGIDLSSYKNYGSNNNYQLNNYGIGAASTKKTSINQSDSATNINKDKIKISQYKANNYVNDTPKYQSQFANPIQSYSTKNQQGKNQCKFTKYNAFSLRLWDRDTNSAAGIAEQLSAENPERNE